MQHALFSGPAKVVQVETTVKKKILIAALDWGLGHATRCIPLIHTYLKEGAEVMLAPTPLQARLWKPHFPNVSYIGGIPEYGIRLPADKTVWWHLMRDYPRIRKVMLAEKDWLAQAVENYQPTHVLTDNRYGLFHPKVHCILLTHQVRLPLPWPLSWWAQRELNELLGPFEELWIPDTEILPGLAGKLSHGSQDKRIRYIGPLSRFQAPAPVSHTTDFEFLAVISGPEPARTVFQQTVLKAFQQINKPCMIICGQPEFQLAREEGWVKIVPHLSDEAFVHCIRKARHIVCRSGYSTLMDLHALQRTALLVPTAGQLEQAYLARHFSKHLGWPTAKETELLAAIQEMSSKD